MEFCKKVSRIWLVRSIYVGFSNVNRNENHQTFTPRTSRGIVTINRMPCREKNDLRVRVVAFAVCNEDIFHIHINVRACVLFDVNDDANAAGMSTDSVLCVVLRWRSLLQRRSRCIYGRATIMFTLIYTTRAMFVQSTGVARSRRPERHHTLNLTCPASVCTITLYFCCPHRNTLCSTRCWCCCNHTVRRPCTIIFIYPQNCTTTALTNAFRLHEHDFVRATHSSSAFA